MDYSWCFSLRVDRVYAETDKFYKHLRYGLTFLEVVDEYSETEIVITDVKLARKGLMRLFEFKIDYILQDIHTINDNSKIISQKDYNIRQYILKDAFDWLQQEVSTGFHHDSDCISKGISNLALSGSSRMAVELCHFTQTDGINAQFSWCPDTQCWVIGSYSVAILARTREDLRLYPGYGKSLDDMDKTEIRYNYVHLIGEMWFNILDELALKNEDFNNQNQPFHTFLSSMTIVGELVGNASIQQIMKYPHSSLTFSSLIKNSDWSATWTIPESLFEFWERWGLNCIPTKTIGVYSDINDLKTAIISLYEQVSIGSIRDFEEGSIMMLIQRDPSNPENDKVLSCWKLKNIEYKVVKKIKEKLKGFWSTYESVQYITQEMEKEYKTKFERFKGEINDMFKIFKKIYQDSNSDQNKDIAKRKSNLINFVKNCFDVVNYDIKMYGILKTDFNKFCKNISKMIKIDSDKFNSQILKK